MQSPLITELIEAFTILPGVGNKTAQRMAYFVLEKQKQGGLNLANKLSQAIEKVGHCQLCRNLTEQSVCDICASTKRHANQLCVVESPTDLFAIEQSAIFKGQYFVLMGHLSPIDGIGPTDLGLDILQQRLATGEIEELILATNPTVEGEATAYYIQQLAQKYAIQITRLAQGIPLGGELEYLDSGTLGHAFTGRTKV